MYCTVLIRPFRVLVSVPYHCQPSSPFRKFFRQLQAPSRCCCCCFCCYSPEPETEIQRTSSFHPHLQASTKYGSIYPDAQAHITVQRSSWAGNSAGTNPRTTSSCKGLATARLHHVLPLLSPPQGQHRIDNYESVPYSERNDRPLELSILVVASLSMNKNNDVSVRPLYLVTLVLR